MRRVLPLGVVVLMSGCTLAPAYERPTPPIPASFPQGVPYQATSVDAPATLTCCPRIARTPSSNPSQAPGTRTPGRAATSFRRRGSALSTS